MQVIKLRDEYIKLGQALKAAGFVESGADAKDVIVQGMVKVNGEVEVQRGKKWAMEYCLYLRYRSGITSIG